MNEKITVTHNAEGHVTAVHVEAADGKPLTPTRLRRIAWDRALGTASKERVAAVAAATGPAVQRPYGGGSTAHLNQVAETFAQAVARNLPARQVIAEKWGRSPATAGRWIAQAREQGLIPSRD
ncbi:hypothetical protein [Streptomyces sp. CS014]|uniref:hypothetical protein n=1 Tax=Streptomyces sp. CS014 TaxID=2162707 RepID=UPI000D517C07|nr:hypothetical protein [Streptomyces sp. CS014]PVD04518.1 hypothetical protein DBP12_03590 [Streptomyces sp. CS014]